MTAREAGVESVDCTPLLAALLLRAAKDARGQGDLAAEARQWLEQDGVALAACLGIDIRPWLRALRPSASSRPPQRVRLTRQHNAASRPATGRPSAPALLSGGRMDSRVELTGTGVRTPPDPATGRDTKGYFR